MASSSILLLSLMIPILVSSTVHRSFAQTRPNCVSQFILANQACSQIPIDEFSINHNSTHPIHAAASDEDDYADEDDNSDDNDAHDGDDGDSERRERHGNGSSGGHNGHGHEHRHGHGHGQSSEHHERHHVPPAYIDCCRWVEDIDEICICASLMRLPPFLTRLHHSFRVRVGETCSRSFGCRGV